MSNVRTVCAQAKSGPLHPAEVPLEKSLAEARVFELAQMKPFDYELIREGEAKALGIRVSALDAAVGELRPKRKPEPDETEIVETLEMWPDPVDGASLTNEIRTCLRAYVVFGADGDADCATLWILGSYLMDTWRLWPRLMICSPTKACGKSTLLEVIDAMAHRGLILSNTKSAGIFRAIQAWHPTLLMDEADTWMKEDQELVGILNSGHTRRSARVMRVEEQGGELVPKGFSTWCPMVIAGIGTQRDTITSRSIIIGLRRKLADERVERLPIDLHHRMTRIRRQAARWAADNATKLGALQTEPPECGNDRRRDNFTPLWRIAEVLGGPWLNRLEAAYAASAQTEDDNEPAGVLLLRDLMEVFHSRRNEKTLPSAELVTALTEMEERPWAEWRHGRPLTAQTMARLMKPFGVKPKDTKLSGRVLKAYQMADIEAAFSRYAAQPVNLPLPRYGTENKQETRKPSRYPMQQGSGFNGDKMLPKQCGSGVADNLATDTGDEAFEGEF